MSSRKLLLVGWDAADWDMIHPLMDRGEMPNLQRLTESGVIGNLASLDPPLSSLLWTSIATGKTADEHRILGFLEPDPISGGARPVTSLSRGCKAIWNILNQNGLRPHVVNWFASHPAEPIRGVCVTNAVCQPTADLPPDSIHPAELEATLAGLRLTPRDLRAEDLALFVPEFWRIDQNKDPRLIYLARVLAEGFTAHAMATWILENQPWDFMAVYLDTIDRAGHEFMMYHPPRMSHVKEEDFELFQHVMNGVYRMHDLMLGRLIQLAGPDATVMVVSDHGFFNGKLRPTGSTAIPWEDSMLWHRQHGIVCLSGPGIRKDELAHGAGLLDVAPTILTLFGLPLAEDMKGRPLLEALEEPARIEKITSWEQVDGDAGMHPPDRQQDPWEATEAVEQLAALGYVEAPSEDAKIQRAVVVHHQNLNLARVHLANGRPAAAIPLLEELDREFPGQPGIRMYLGRAYFYTRQFERSKRIADDLIAGPENRPLAHILRANSCIWQGNEAEALDHLLRAEEMQGSDPNICVLVGQAHLRLRRPGDAEICFRKALDLESRAPRSWRALATALLTQKRHREAAEAALEAVGLDYSNPYSHYLLGLALVRGGSIERAVQALESCLKIEPKAFLAHRLLAAIHTNATGDTERARQHRESADALRAPQPAAAEPALPGA